jgi:hypothetical protein
MIQFQCRRPKIFALAQSSAALSETADVVRRLLVTNASELYKLALSTDAQYGGVFFIAPSFADLVEQCQSLKVLKLEQIALDEDHIGVNGMSIHTIRRLPDDYSERELFRGSVIPYLEMNRLRPRVHAIPKNSPTSVPCQGAGKSTSCSSY